MSKTKTTASERPPERQAERSPERQALADAIRARDEVEARLAPRKQAQSRVEADIFLARRDVEAAEEALSQARERERGVLADAYASGSAPDRSATTEAETALARAQRRLADLKLIAPTLAAKAGEDYPAESILQGRVEDAVKAVVAASPSVRRLVEDYEVARRALKSYHGTARWLAFRGMVPDDLKATAPKPNEVYHSGPDPTWEAAIAQLAIDPEAQLP
jgi:hypothetical protein